MSYLVKKTTVEVMNGSRQEIEACLDWTIGNPDIVTSNVEIIGENEAVEELFDAYEQDDEETISRILGG